MPPRLLAMLGMGDRITDESEMLMDSTSFMAGVAAMAAGIGTVATLVTRIVYDRVNGNRRTPGLCMQHTDMRDRLAVVEARAEGLDRRVEGQLQNITENLAGLEHRVREDVKGVHERLDQIGLMRKDK